MKIKIIKKNNNYTIVITNVESKQRERVSHPFIITTVISSEGN